MASAESSPAVSSSDAERVEVGGQGGPSARWRALIDSGLFDKCYSQRITACFKVASCISTHFTDLVGSNRGFPPNSTWTRRRLATSA